MNPWLPIVVLLLLAVAFAGGSVLLSRFTGPRRDNDAGLDPYECGVQAAPTKPGRRFPVRFSVTAMLFIVFDVEIVFLYPWAVSLSRFGVSGLVEMLLFVAPVLVAYLYVRRKGGLDWD
ncbi:NADH-quinone oxidoreductase subunit A [Amycolatopsis sp. SID8362]|uniref:NADH-quinone oxidoreductase subunit A n=1 Tax=Amycolatopsis sp. SID8362 TaxID=2690346 RepID=UPI001370A6A6|nr:NADH-quinone oxidoreductase subunit A [Amycolatopsis sp. SID8362]NBH04369.1 NAD(P)H-quinone oxidoreductase subunit 3 [Amycolatopsis sp. SID8362]NED41068.1 NAD(P)H-quinone oxidoreductase subunit 3 [Amycolatopsis sp. SID8362]